MKKLIRWGVALVVVVGGGFAAYATRDLWFERVRERIAKIGKKGAATAGSEDGVAKPADPHAGHAHSATEAVTLTDQAAKNLGLKTAEVEPTEYWKSIAVPATVAEQPGRSERRLTAVMHGIVLRVYAMPGQTIRSGEPVLDLQIIGEGLVTAQANLLRTLQEVELVDAELKRIAPIIQSGGLPEKTKIEKEYERRRLDAAQKVQIQELLVRGLTQEQINAIVESKELLRELTIVAPARTTAAKMPVVKGRTAPAFALVSNQLPTDQLKEKGPTAEDVFTVEKIDIFPGKHVQPGDPLCDLALHSMLVIEGTAFESEASSVARAIEKKWPVSAQFDPEEGKPVNREGLRILYVDNVVDSVARTLKFAVPLPNEIVRDDRGPDGKDYRIWRFRPGQKLRLFIPVEKWTDRIVIPVEGVVREGPDAFVFRANGKQMERVAVHLEYQDDKNAVIANDGSLFPGDVIGLNGAYQLNLAIKKAAGSGIDPHAGHNH